MNRLEALIALARGEVVELPPPPPQEEILVPPSGPLDAFIAVIGESAGVEEIEHNPPAPFVGKSGKLLRTWARHAGINLSTCYIDNTYPYLPPGKKLKNVPKEVLSTEITKMYERLMHLTQVRVIVACGNLSLSALTGFEGISKHRGSI